MAFAINASLISGCQQQYYRIQNCKQQVFDYVNTAEC
jgi:hypothetical protein